MSTCKAKGSVYSGSLALVLTGLMLLCQPAWSQPAALLPENPPVFQTGLPEGFEDWREGVISVNQSAIGRYQMLSNPQTHVLALVIRINPGGHPPHPLDESHPVILAHYLFESFVGLCSPIHIRCVRKKSSTTLPTAWLKVSFPDRFVEPDTLTQVQSHAGVRYIILLGRPHAGSKRRVNRFTDSYLLMQQAERQILDKLLP